jgi:transcription initiation factor TFIIB
MATSLPCATASCFPRTFITPAKPIHTIIYQEKRLKGKRTEDMSASIVLLTCRAAGVPLTFKEVCAVTNVSKRRTGRFLELLKRILKGTDIMS